MAANADAGRSDASQADQVTSTSQMMSVHHRHTWCTFGISPSDAGAELIGAGKADNIKGSCKSTRPTLNDKCSAPLYCVVQLQACCTMTGRRANSWTHQNQIHHRISVTLSRHITFSAMCKVKRCAGTAYSKATSCTAANTTSQHSSRSPCYSVQAHLIVVVRKITSNRNIVSGCSGSHTNMTC
jgi:hypothetical protein